MGLMDDLIDSAAGTYTSKQNDAALSRSYGAMEKFMGADLEKRKKGHLSNTQTPLRVTPFEDQETPLERWKKEIDYMVKSGNPQMQALGMQQYGNYQATATTPPKEVSRSASYKAARDAGYTPGTKEFYEFVERHAMKTMMGGEGMKSGKLTDAEMNELGLTGVYYWNQKTGKPEPIGESSEDRIEAQEMQKITNRKDLLETSMRSYLTTLNEWRKDPSNSDKLQAAESAFVGVQFDIANRANYQGEPSGTALDQANKMIPSPTSWSQIASPGDRTLSGVRAAAALYDIDLGEIEMAQPSNLAIAGEVSSSIIDSVGDTIEGVSDYFNPTKDNKVEPTVEDNSVSMRDIPVKQRTSATGSPMSKAYRLPDGRIVIEYREGPAIVSKGGY